jgi:hypothetical protein
MIVKFVDAARIRNSIDTNFSSGCTHAEFPYIPLGEMWIDKYQKDERDLYLALLKFERSLRGKSFRLIREKARKTFVVPKGARVVIKKSVRKGPYIVDYVDGTTVRKALDPYFDTGGHDLVYSYIPKKHIWIDMRSEPKEWKYTLIHEIDERERMAKGMGYDDAHDFAIATERMARRKDGVADFQRG